MTTPTPAPAEADGWRTIETAPKDGTPHIICAMVNGPIVGEATYHALENADEGWWWANTGPGDYHAEKISPEPFAWRPLPAPPAAQEEEYMKFYFGDWPFYFALVIVGLLVCLIIGTAGYCIATDNPNACPAITKNGRCIASTLGCEGRYDE